MDRGDYDYVKGTVLAEVGMGCALNNDHSGVMVTKERVCRLVYARVCITKNK